VVLDNSQYIHKAHEVFQRQTQPWLLTTRDCRSLPALAPQNLRVFTTLIRKYRKRVKKG
jgi:hypothetical protein